MKIQIVTGSDKAYESFSLKSFKSLELYCKRDCVFYPPERVSITPEAVPLGKSPAWCKLSVITNAIESGAFSSDDWIVWVDADTVVANLRFDLAGILNSLPQSKIFWFASDLEGHLSTGVFAVRVRTFSLRFLDAVSNFGSISPEKFHLYDGRDTWEQSSIKALSDNYPVIKGTIQLANPEIIQVPFSERFNRHAWLAHFWMGPTRTPEIVENWIDQVMTLGWNSEIFEEIKLPNGRR